MVFFGNLHEIKSQNHSAFKKLLFAPQADSIIINTPFSKEKKHEKNRR